MGGVAGGLCAAPVSAALALPPGPGAPSYLGYQGCGRASHYDPDGAGAVRRIGEPDQPDAGYRAGVFPAYGQRFLAVFFRPTRRTATGNFRHCHCHRHTPQPVRPPGRFPPIVFQCHIGLGVALGAVDRHSRCPRVNHTRRADIGDTVSAQGLHSG